MEIIGHRGAKGLVCENTLESIAEALKYGLKAVEVDLRATKDNKIIFFHDEDLERLANRKVKIKDKTLAELKEIKLQDKYKIPTLDEAFEKFGPQLTWHLEIKDEKVIPLLAKQKLPAKIIFSSFNLKDLKLLKKYLPKRKLALISKKFDKKTIKKVKELKLEALHLKITKANHKNLKTCKQENIKVRIWNINDPEQAKFYETMGVAGIFTDRADLINHKQLV